MFFKLIISLLGISDSVRAFDLGVTQLLQQNLWLDCSCLHAIERFGNTSTGRLSLDAKQMGVAKNNCYIIFVTGLDDEIVSLRFTKLQLAANCSEYIQIYPYLRDLVIENSTDPALIICNQSTSLPEANEIIYSAGQFFGMRIKFVGNEQSTTSQLLLDAEYRFLKKEYFRTDGRLIAGSFCDYYFFSQAEYSHLENIWQYFHSPRFPAKYPSHIKCTYKFIGRRDSMVEIGFEELHLPQHNDSCNLDTITIFDGESVNMNDVLELICWPHQTKRVISTGPDLLIEFNASSNITAKGFRGRFRFLKKELTKNDLPTNLLKSNSESNLKSENCHKIFDSRLNQSGKFETKRILNSAVFAQTKDKDNSQLLDNALECRYEFYGNSEERVQIKFLDFNLPTTSKNSSECSVTNSLQLMKFERGNYVIDELYCGVFLPKPIMSYNSQMILQLIVQELNESYQHKFYGFKAEFRFLKNYGITSGTQLADTCAFIYNSTERKVGIFTTPNFPGLYPRNLTCNYYFYGEPKETIIISFTYFDVEGVGDCEYMTASDYVELSNFITRDRKFNKICGFINKKFEVKSDANFFRVTFHANDRFDKTGFRAQYQFIIKKPDILNVSRHEYFSSSTLALHNRQAAAVILLTTVEILVFCLQCSRILVRI